MASDGMAVPPGFERWRARDGGFLAHNGPVYLRHEGGFTLGFRVLERHCNNGGMCHGGMLSSLADMLLIGGSKAELGFQDFTMTISLACDFLDKAPLGSWIEGRTQVVRATRTLVFAECRLTIEGQPILRANGILRRPPE